MQEQFVAGGKQLESISIESSMQVQGMGIIKILTILLLICYPYWFFWLFF